VAVAQVGSGEGPLQTMLPSLNRDATTLSYNLELVPNILAAK